LFVILAATHIYLRAKGKTNSNLDKNIVYWKDRIEFIFVLLMSVLLIYLFNPRKDKSVLINYETKLLLYLFGFVLLIMAKWDTFIEEAKWFKDLQEIIN
jgi:CHASE2 domain-containing sensor protein